jgi:benzoyl-CoA reductase/2-hydroxyglutaryl-CoA dehydratase subunit BcrC/BadD/HgdB
MDLVHRYGEWIKNKLPDNPKAAGRYIRLGLVLESFAKKHLGDKNVPAPYRDLNVLALNGMRHTLEHPETAAWTNLFTPVEILQTFGLNCLSIEMMGSFLAGFTIEDWCIDQAEASGIAPTLCSYHKSFIGAVENGLIPNPKCAVTTSIVCDANLQTFRYTASQGNVPLTLLDIPNAYSKDGVHYVVTQLKAWIASLEDLTHQHFDEVKLKAALSRENASFATYAHFLDLTRTRAYPSTLTLQMFVLYASHLIIGSPEALAFFKALEADAKTRPMFSGKRLFWLHVLPFYQPALKAAFNLSQKYQIQATDMNLDYNKPLDVEHPLEALAEKMMKNIFVGPLTRRIAAERDLIKGTGADGVIAFNHWGCKQMAGAAALMKDALKDTGVPFLILDGDGIDPRNTPEGQIKTRLEAFLEML